jgi:hypothetical protein
VEISKHHSKLSLHWKMFCILTNLPKMLTKRKLLKSKIRINNGVTICNLMNKLKSKHKMTLMNMWVHLQTKIAKSMETKILLILVKILHKDSKEMNGILKTIMRLKNLMTQTTMSILIKESSQMVGKISRSCQKTLRKKWNWIILN